MCSTELPSVIRRESLDIAILIFCFSALHPSEWAQAIRNVFEVSNQSTSCCVASVWDSVQDHSVCGLLIPIGWVWMDWLQSIRCWSQEVAFFFETMPFMISLNSAWKALATCRTIYISGVMAPVSTIFKKVIIFHLIELPRYWPQGCLCRWTGQSLLWSLYCGNWTRIFNRTTGAWHGDRSETVGSIWVNQHSSGSASTS